MLRAPCSQVAHAVFQGAQLALSAAQLHRRLAAYYAAFYAVLGAFLPYMSLWLVARNLSPSQIGLIFALHGATRLAFPLAWGWLADRWGRRMLLIRIASAMAFLGLLILPFSSSFGGILFAVVVFSVFWNATMPQFEAVTLGHIRETGGDYSQIRLWGSVGFVVAVVGLGYLFEHVPITGLPWIMLLFIAAMVFSSCLVPEDKEVARDADQTDLNLWQAIRQPLVMALLAVVFLSQMSFAPYYSFFSLYLTQHGYPAGQIGLLWAFGVVMEIWVFVYTGRLITRFGVHAMMIVALLTTCLRWLLLPIGVDHLPLLLLLQALHMTSFGVFHACSIYYIGSLFPGRMMGRGQALYVSFGFGLGGSLGAWGAGLIWEQFDPDAVYYSAAIAAGLGCLIAWRGLAQPPQDSAVRANSLAAADVARPR